MGKMPFNDTVIDLTTPETVDLCSTDSSEDDLETILPRFEQRLVSKLRPIVIDVDDDTSSSAESSLGVGNSYGDFAPLFDFKKSVAPCGYIEFDGNEDNLSVDTWHNDRQWWLDKPKTAVAPLSWLPPTDRSLIPVSQNFDRADRLVHSAYLA